MDANWTVMVLMGANNLPSEEPLERFAQDDLKEMQSVGSKSGALNIVVQIDQKPEAGGPKRYFVAKGQLRDVGPIPRGQGSSGDPVGTWRTSSIGRRATIRPSTICWCYGVTPIDWPSIGTGMMH